MGAASSFANSRDRFLPVNFAKPDHAEDPGDEDENENRPKAGPQPACAVFCEPAVLIIVRKTSGRSRVCQEDRGPGTSRRWSTD